MSFGPALSTRDDTYDETAYRSAFRASDGVRQTDAGPERNISTSETFAETAVSVSIGALRATDFPAVIVDATGCGTPVDESNSGVTGMGSGSDSRTDACIAPMGFNVTDICGVAGATTELGSALD